MSIDEQRLRADAAAIQRRSASAGQDERLQAQLRMTGQLAAERLAQPRWSGWSMPAAVAASLIAALLLLPEQSTDTVPEPLADTNNSTLPADAAVSVINRPAAPLTLPLQTVADTQALEQEWQSIRNDLRNTGEQIRQELPFDF